MRKARIFLALTALCVVVNVFLSYKVSNRNLNNLYRTTTGVVTIGTATRLLTYATLAPYRTFPMDLSEPIVHPTISLWLDVTFTTITIGGAGYTYTVTTNFPWNLPIYADNNQ